MTNLLRPLFRMNQKFLLLTCNIILFLSDINIVNIIKMSMDISLSLLLIV